METKKLCIYLISAAVIIAAALGVYLENWGVAGITFAALTTLAVYVILIFLFARMAEDTHTIKRWIEWYFTKDDPQDEEN